MISKCYQKVWVNRNVPGLSVHSYTIFSSENLESWNTTPVFKYVRDGTYTINNKNNPSHPKVYKSIDKDDIFGNKVTSDTFLRWSTTNDTLFKLNPET